MAATASPSPRSPRVWPARAMQATTIATSPVMMPNNGIPISDRMKAPTLGRFQRRAASSDWADPPPAFVAARAGRGTAAARSAAVIVSAGTLAARLPATFVPVEHSYDPQRGLSCQQVS